MLACIIFPTQAFSATTEYFSSRRVVGGHSKSSGCAYAVFEDADCEDLCDATEFFADYDTPAASETQIDEQKTATKERTNANSSTSQQIRPLWWTDTGQDECESCKGKGDMKCRFCGGTNFMSAIGGNTDDLFNHAHGPKYMKAGKECPVCNEGREQCQKCSGTGVIFSWSSQYDRNTTLSP